MGLIERAKKGMGVQERNKGITVAPTAPLEKTSLLGSKWRDVMSAATTS